MQYEPEKPPTALIFFFAFVLLLVCLCGCADIAQIREATQRTAAATETSAKQDTRNDPFARRDLDEALKNIAPPIEYPNPLDGVNWTQFGIWGTVLYMIGNMLANGLRGAGRSILNRKGRP